jgi:hypothetical protein
MSDQLFALSTTLQQIHAEYEAYREQIVQGTSKRLVLAERMLIAKMGADFMRHQHAVVVEQATERWAKQVGIWKPDYSPDTNTMGAYLNPETPNDPRIDSDTAHPFTAKMFPHLDYGQRRATVINMIYMLMFYFDDTISNEHQKMLSREQQALAYQLVQNVINLLAEPKLAVRVKDAQAPALLAMRDILLILDEMADPRWLADFLSSMHEHMLEAQKDQDTGQTQRVLTFEQYIAVRAKVSGMVVTSDLIFLATDDYLPHGLETEHPHMFSLYRKLRDLVVYIGAFGNDIFSFENEVIRNKSEFNVIVNTILLNPHLTLLESIDVCIEELNDKTRELRACVDEMQARLPDCAERYRVPLQSLMQQSLYAAEATWAWELDTERYSKENAIFVETDRGERVRMGLLGRLVSGVPLAHRDQRITPDR